MVKGRMVLAAALAALMTASATAADPQAAFDAAAALEKQWLDFKAGKSREPPSTFKVDQADRALTDIPLNWPRADDAIALIKRLRAARPAIDKAYDAFVAEHAARERAAREKELLAKRKRAPQILETAMLDVGRDAYVSAEGKELRTLRIKYALMGRVMVHQFEKNTEFRQMVRDLGFAKIIFADGYGKAWELAP